jgi:hydrogenase-4 component E
LAARLPFIVEVAFLFDLLVAVVVFGVLMRLHHGLSQTLSTDALDRLRG